MNDIFLYFKEVFMKIFSKIILTLSVLALANPVQVSAGWKTKAAAGAAGVAFLGLVTWAYFKKQAPAANGKNVQPEPATSVDVVVAAPQAVAKEVVLEAVPERESYIQRRQRELRKEAEGHGKSAISRGTDENASPDQKRKANMRTSIHTGTGPDLFATK
jgi:hypothetical protein